ncbi:FliM/FliN family flagellar motor switch protein [Rhodovulum adriaticum]|nr:FliM/FliN family flagellar motor switch protein [Rhodovulum adriaticum]
MERLFAPADGGVGACDVQAVAAALPLAVARAGHERLGLTLVAGKVTVSAPALGGLAEVLPGAGLPLLLRGASGVGLAVFSAELALALLEWCLTGDIAAQAPPLRPLTATDAAVLADFTDPMLSALGGETGPDWARGYAQGPVLEDARHLALRLAPGAYRGFATTVSLGEGARGGTLFLALPGPQAPASPDRGAEPFSAGALQDSVLAARVPLRAVLWRMQMPAAALRQLAPGQDLVLPAAALARVRLEGAGAIPLAQGRLGQAHGERAVRLEGEAPGGALPPPAADVAEA